MTWTTQPRSEGAGDLAYWAQGAGAPLVLIHGVGLRAEAWAAAMPHLAASFTVYAVDMPGHGQSPLGAARGLNDYADRVELFIRSIGDAVVVAGHSMGAMIALEVAARCPDRVVGVAAFNAIYRRTAEAAKAVQDRAAALASNVAPAPDATVQRWFGSDPQGAIADAAEACGRWLISADKTAYAAAYRVFAHHDGPTNDVLAGLICPALFQTGARDPNSTPDMSREMARIVPTGRAESVPGAAHMLPMTHPEAVTEALRTSFATQR